ncbi:MAG: aromatic-ring-hydroxylating dioxygenase subunit beta [Rhodospirillaceae bacterium]|jgi:benzoate/toluate 1,2-dioxygenase beta subunit|nr:aromatic-ring-hydroxylating dioxygenase subunit beta [Rhodospirillaceae bacterium]MBT4589313.1 aromatic-ring-hydroxylating dioxygenase subunit beta [Rhodospirillaceae bacterium]MBT4938727.1 aromatic-ring-hydroxylating dioxygenase subunit beta [Rhodospirillaceae bacterium]MBT5938811.1 aromatic-ring-hydroxylating dioxygenase subunit beta [Rhodospirillaceae bacterium]MBT7266757.1 aromatic-ring-hydroxylating dioxygenase subunit beta [Rhodospirillaceae bacterium]
MNHDPSKTSHYIGNQYYADLVQNYSDWQGDDNEISDPILRESCRRFLEKEARLLESDRHDDWLGLYAPECLYWVPASVGGGDPRKEVAVAFDDRRRLEDRVFRLQNEYAWSQQPISRTVRLVSNVTVFACDEPSIVMVRSNFLITEFQAGDKRSYTGWSGHRLQDRDESWQILVKQVNLIDCDQNLRNPSIIL